MSNVHINFQKQHFVIFPKSAFHKGKKTGIVCFATPKPATPKTLGKPPQM